MPTEDVGDVTQILKVAPGAASLNVLPMLPRPVSSILSLATHRSMRRTTPSRRRR